METKYSSSKIYHLNCSDGHYYIGSTISVLSFRLNNHKQLAKKESISRAYQYINSIGWDNVDIKLIENYSCNSKKELNAREALYINEAIAKNDMMCLNIENTITPPEPDSENPYSEGKIYQIICSDGSYYIGSTRNTLPLRLLNHKRCARNFPERQLYKHISEIGWDDIKMELIEDYPCTSKEELNEREDYYIQLAKVNNDELCLNINRALVTPDELKTKQQLYRDANKEKIDDYMAHYRLENAEKRRQYSREYAATNVETVRETKKRYNAENKERMAAYFKQYAEEHKEKIDAYKNEWARNKRAQGREERVAKRQLATAVAEAARREVITCECGGAYQPHHKSRHEESKRHQKFLSP